MTASPVLLAASVRSVRTIPRSLRPVLAVLTVQVAQQAQFLAQEASTVLLQQTCQFRVGLAESVAPLGSLNLMDLVKRATIALMSPSSAVAVAQVRNFVQS